MPFSRLYTFILSLTENLMYITIFMSDIQKEENPVGLITTVIRCWPIGSACMRKYDSRNPRGSNYNSHWRKIKAKPTHKSGDTKAQHIDVWA